MFTIPTLVYSTVGLLSINMLNGIIIGTSNTLQTIYYLLPQNSSTLNKYKIQIESLDIDFKLQIITQWINKDHNKYTNDSPETKTFNKIKDGIGESCIKISNILDEINKEIAYHNTKYFSYYRSLDLNDLINRLTHQCKIMNERIALINLI